MGVLPMKRPRPRLERSINYDAPVYVLRPLKSDGRTFKRGDLFDWRRLDVTKRRLTTLFAARKLGHAEDLTEIEQKEFHVQELQEQLEEQAKENPVIDEAPDLEGEFTIAPTPEPVSIGFEHPDLDNAVLLEVDHNEMEHATGPAPEDEIFIETAEIIEQEPSESDIIHEEVVVDELVNEPPLNELPEVNGDLGENPVFDPESPVLHFNPEELD